MDNVTAEHGIQVLIPPDASKRDGPRPGWTGGRYDWMRRVLATELGEELYRTRKQTVEPVFGHTKHNRKFGRFHRRGRAAVRTEWRLMMMTHNLTKLYSHQLAAAPQTHLTEHSGAENALRDAMPEGRGSSKRRGAA
jgi:hypothetical protein